MGEESKTRGSLQMHYDLAREQKEWVAQRIGWGMMFLLCVGALTGALGGGPVSSRQEGKVGDDLYLEYERFVRHQAPFRLKVFCKPPEDGLFTLSFTRGFLDHHEIKEIQPEPESTTLDGDKCVYSFNGHSAREQLITFRFEAETFGKIQNEVMLNGKTTRKMEQFIWP